MKIKEKMETPKEFFEEIPDIWEFRKMTGKKAAAEAGGIIIALLFCLLNLVIPVNPDIIGLILVSGLFGTITGLIAGAVIFAVITFIIGGTFAICPAISCQVIAIVTSASVKKGCLKSKSRMLFLSLLLSLIQITGFAAGDKLDELGRGVISSGFSFNSKDLLSFPIALFAVWLLSFIMKKMPDRYLPYLPNFHEYIRDEALKRNLEKQIIRTGNRSVGAVVSRVIAIVATAMTLAAIALFNTLYFKPEALEAGFDRNRMRMSVSEGRAPWEGRGLPPGEAPETPGSRGEAPEEPGNTGDGEELPPDEGRETGQLSRYTKIRIGENIITAEEIEDLLTDGPQLGSWRTRAGIAKNLAFFLKFVLGLVYLELVAIAFAVFYVNRRIVRPIEGIAFAMDRFAGATEWERIENSRFIHSIRFSTGDELESLHKSFLKMVDDFNDYVERLKKENELKRDLEVEKASNEAKSAFLSNMSHELRTPINAVLGMDEMILRESEEENITAYAEDIRNAGKSLLGLINDILDFSKIEAGKMEIIPVDYELSSVINDLFNMVRTKLEGKGLEFFLKVNPDMPHLLKGDEIRLKQVITNILSNAVKYTEKGSITFELGYEMKGEKEMDLLVSVRDTGIGIREEDLKKLFTAFERIEEKRNRTIEGTGLGMNITQNLLNMMGSTLQVKSVYGEGSDFHFCLRQGVNSREPIGDVEETYRKSLEKREKYRESFRAPRSDILVVDDTPMNLSVIRGLLKRTQIRIDTAESGFECLEMIKEKRYDIIFLDHRMPEMDGIETLQRIKEEGDSLQQGVPVVALTANAVSGAREEYLKAGFDDYITKPVDGVKLEKLIRELLPDGKVVYVPDGEGEDSGEENSEKSLPEWIKELNGLDYKEGIKNCGSAEEYLKALKLFYDSAEDNSEKIREYFEKGDRNNYNIKVHALKSSLRLIGAAELSALALSLEEASSPDSNSGETGYSNGSAGEADSGKSVKEGLLKEGTPVLLEGCGKLKEMLSPLTEGEEEGDSGKPVIDPEAFREARSSLAELIGVADFESALMIIHSLEAYRMPDIEEEERFKTAKKAAELFDWDSVEAWIKGG